MNDFQNGFWHSESLKLESSGKYARVRGVLVNQVWQQGRKPWFVVFAIISDVSVLPK